MGGIQVVGLAFVAAGVVVWLLGGRVDHDHAASKPAARARPGVAGVWSPGKRAFHLASSRVYAVGFVVAGLLIAFEVL